MEFKSKKARIIETAIETFEYSSIHGLTNIIKNKFLAIKVLWVIVITGSATACIYLQVKNIIQYLNYEVTSQILIQKEQEMVFATVKI
jgi:hypothetical protein